MDLRPAISSRLNHGPHSLQMLQDLVQDGQRHLLVDLLGEMVRRGEIDFIICDGTTVYRVNGEDRDRSAKPRLKKPKKLTLADIYTPNQLKIREALERARGKP